jgi:hypothetical protein
VKAVIIINKVTQFFDQEKSSANLKFPIENATKSATAAMEKSEVTICKISKEANIASISRKKLVTWSKRIELDDLDFCVIKQSINNSCTVKKEVPTLKI